MMTLLAALDLADYQHFFSLLQHLTLMVNMYSQYYHYNILLLLLVVVFIIIIVVIIIINIVGNIVCVKL